MLFMYTHIVREADMGGLGTCDSDEAAGPRAGGVCSRRLRQLGHQDLPQ
jgi:hypothetical protein